MPQQMPSNGNGAARIELVGGHPVVLVGDRMFALPVINSTTPVPNLGAGTALNSQIKQSVEPPALSHHVDTNGLPFGSQRAQTQSPLTGLDLGTLKTQQALKKQELRGVEQTEVLQANQQSESWRMGVIEKKRSLIVELDTLRKQIAALENDNTNSNQTNSFLGPIGTTPGLAHQPPFMPQPQQSLAPAMYAFPASNPYASMMMYQPSAYGSFAGFPVVEPTPFVTASTNPPHSPGSAGRRSHAIEIKPPQAETKKQQSSNLDPKSPTYEPPNNTNFKRNVGVSNVSSSQRQPWHTRGEPQTNGPGPRAPSHKPSLSSIDTTDFFPNDTHEYSTTRLAPHENETKLSEDKATPSTPEKHWPASPWNEGTSGRSRTSDAENKLTSWPEAFGIQKSSSSLRTSVASQPSAVMRERAPVLGAYSQTHAANNDSQPVKGPVHRIEEENHPFVRKATPHAPSTWQEGWQAGYDHVGMPHNEAVLEGYAQGILRFLADGTKKSRMEAPLGNSYGGGMESKSSLRGLLAGSTPHDSAIGMTFERNDSLIRSHENTHTSKNVTVPDSHRSAAYSPSGSVKDFPVSHAPVDATGNMRSRNVSNMQPQKPTVISSERCSSNRQGGSANGVNERKVYQDQGSMNRSDGLFSIGGFRQFSGTQLQNYNTPLSKQRFYHTPKEMVPGSGRGHNASTARSFVDHRLSGLDGAMDDLADMVADTHVDNSRASHGVGVVNHQPPNEAEEATASCFGPTGGKGKQKAPSSPKKMSAETRNAMCSSPVTLPSSPRKSGEHSPAKVKIEQVTNKFRRSKRDDPRTMSPDERAKRSDRWRQRFQHLKRSELEEVDETRKNPRS